MNQPEWQRRLDELERIVNPPRLQGARAFEEAIRALDSRTNMERLAASLRPSQTISEQLNRAARDAYRGRYAGSIEESLRHQDPTLHRIEAMLSQSLRQANLPPWYLTWNERFDQAFRELDDRLQTGRIQAALGSERVVSVLSRSVLDAHRFVRLHDTRHIRSSTKQLPQILNSLKQSTVQAIRDLEPDEVDATTENERLTAANQAAEALSLYRFDGDLVRTVADLRDDIRDLHEKVGRLSQKLEPPLAKRIFFGAVKLLIPLVLRILWDNADIDVSIFHKVFSHGIPPEHTEEVRLARKWCFVRVAGSLNVRKEPNSKSRILGRLLTGDFVQAARSSGDWSYVEFRMTDSDDTSLKGWVFSKYLHPLLP
jgi:hypothetical protein